MAEHAEITVRIVDTDQVRASIEGLRAALFAERRLADRLAEALVEAGHSDGCFSYAHGTMNRCACGMSVALESYEASRALPSAP